MRNRYFFPAVIAAILVVLAIMAVILLVLGDNENQGEDTGPDPSPESAPLAVRQLHLPEPMALTGPLQPRASGGHA